MRATFPSLLTLLDWLDQRASAWDAWRASSPEAARRAALLVEVTRLLDEGEWLGEPIGASAEQVAAYLEGALAPAEATEFEATCWARRANLAEVVSEWRFRRAEREVAPSRKLSERLLSLAPPPTPITPVVVAAPPAPFETPVESLVESPVVIHTQTRCGARRAKPGRRPRRWEAWQVAVAALAAMIAAAIGLATWAPRRTVRPAHESDQVAEEESRPARSPRRPGAGANDERREAPERDVERMANDGAPDSDGSRRRRPDSKTETPDSTTPDLAPKPERAVEGPTLVERSGPPPNVRPRPGVENPVRGPRVANAAKLQVRSELGLLLVRRGENRSWRAAQDDLTLDEPLEFTSLDDSWSTTEIPQVGTLVWEGAAAARLRATDDGVVQIELEQGRIGVQNLAAGARLDVQAGGTRFRATGVGDYSTLAVVNEPLGSAAYVPSGIIAIGETQVGARQAVRWTGGAMSAPQTWETAAANSGEASFDSDWLQGPDERRRREWRNLHGKLAERLRESSDVAATLAELRGQTRDGRQAAILASWNLAIAEDPGAELWEMLNDRVEAVRGAGVRRLLQLPPRELRESGVYERLREATDETVARRVIEWTLAARRNPTLNANLARELVDQLQHSQLAVRQVSVSLLERAAAPAFQQLRRKPPTYDAAASVSKRQAAQLEWRQIVLQLYAPRRK